MLGLTSSETLSAYWSKNTRRKIFYSYPNGTAPLTGLLSMLDQGDWTPIQEFGWNEKRWQAIQTVTAAGPTANVAFYNGGTTTTAGSPAQITAGASYRVYVASATDFQINNTIVIFDLAMTAGPTNNVSGLVTAVNSSAAPFYIEFTASATTASTVVNTGGGTAGNIGNYVYFSGSSYAEGTRTDTGRILFPYEVKNFTQIHKTRFDLTRNALKEPLVYDKSGAYKDTLKTNGIDHLTGIEQTLFFQQRYQTTAQVKGKTVRRYQSGGIKWFLDQWELGSVAAGGAFDYGQPNVSTQTDWRTYTNKRVIDLGGQTISRSDFNDLNSRQFEKTNANDWCKVCLCGPGYYNRVSDVFEKQITVQSTRDNGFKGFDFQFNMHTSNAGTIYYKVHPLFNDPYMRNSAFYIDPGYIKWRPFLDSDTDIIPNVQENDEDIRADMWLTEGGPEFIFPEAHMFVKNLGGITL